MHDLSEWLQEFAENMVDGKASIPEAAGPREPSIQEPPPKVESKKQNVFTHFPKDRQLPSMQKDQNYTGALQKTHRLSHTTRRKCW